MALSYIRAMGNRKRKSKAGRRAARRATTWQISRLRGTPAAFVGLVDAPDAATAKQRAIKQFAIRPEDQKRLIAVRHHCPRGSCPSNVGRLVQDDPPITVVQGDAFESHFQSARPRSHSAQHEPPRSLCAIQDHAAVPRKLSHAIALDSKPLLPLEPCHWLY